MKNKFPLIVAAVVGVVAFFAIRSYVNKMEQATQAQLRGDPVVAASRELPAGTQLTMQMIVAKPVPRKFIPSQAIEGVAQVKQVIGRKTAVPIKAGQIILWTDLAGEGRGGLASVIPTGEGAYTVSIGKGIKPALLQPSDHVDIIGSFAVPKPGFTMPATTAANWRPGPDMVNIVLLQNVTVLAVGEQYSGAAKTPGAGGGDLTLSLTLPESQLLMFASEHGELGVVLRRSGDSDVKPRAELPRLTFDAIDKLIGDLDGRRSLRLVEVQQGLKTTTVPVASQKPESALDFNNFDSLDKSAASSQ
jgi:pilus assembly protein CpaB